jgi:L-amino acid N-acyltransferase YncA
MIIRSASFDELPALSAIYDHEVFHGTSTFDTEPRSPEAQQAWWASHQDHLYPLLVAVEPPSTVLGWGCLSPWSPRGAYARTVEGSVFVHADHRLRGVGRALLEAIVERARAASHRVVLGRIEASNEPSRKMLFKLGFSSVGVMHAVGEKFGRVLDVELFELVL